MKVVECFPVFHYNDPIMTRNVCQLEIEIDVAASGQMQGLAVEQERLSRSHGLDGNAPALDRADGQLLVIAERKCVGPRQAAPSVRWRVRINLVAAQDGPDLLLVEIGEVGLEPEDADNRMKDWKSQERS